MALTKEDIVNLLATNDKAVCRALVVLNKRQTYDEQVSENTKHLNGRGFRPAHARMGTSMANFFTRNGYLTPKQIAYWRRPMKTGTPRIAIYWKQLLEEAQAKEVALRFKHKGVPAVVPAATPYDDYVLENEKWREMKNEFARKEAVQEQMAFMNSPD